MSAIVEIYRGIAIRQDDDGFYAGANFGYADTVAEIRTEIDDAFAEDAAHYADIDTPPDTPSIDTSFHDWEVAI